MYIFCSIFELAIFSILKLAKLILHYDCWFGIVKIKLILRVKEIRINESAYVMINEQFTHTCTFIGEMECLES